MKLFSSWSGGKDAAFALYRILQTQEHEVVALVNMCDEAEHRSRSHGLSTQLIQRQAACLGIPLIQKAAPKNEYEIHFKAVLAELKEQGVKGGVFGDIFLKAHREWIEQVCGEMELKAFFPLWGFDTEELLQQWIREGFKALTVSVNDKHLSNDWLGKTLDMDFYEQLSAMQGVDPCAEFGEYHTFVYDGPIFLEATPFKKDKVYYSDNHWFLELT